jgi:hypothetical protein
MFLPEKVFWLRFKGEHGSAAVEMLYSAVTAPGLNSVCSDPTRLMLGVHRGISGHESLVGWLVNHLGPCQKVRKSLTNHFVKSNRTKVQSIG